MVDTRASFSFSGGTREDPDLVYYNVDIINNGAQSDPTQIDTPDPGLRFSETRNIPIISDASKYEMSITRFVVNGPGRNVPVFMPQIALGTYNGTQFPGLSANNINKTVYVAGLSASVIVGGQTYTTSASYPVIWVPEIQDPVVAPVPPTPVLPALLTQQDVSTRYYWCMSISHWVNLVNTAYQNCWNQLQTNLRATALGPGFNLQTLPPVILYNPTSNLFTIYADQYGFGGAYRGSVGKTQDESLQMYMDANLFGMYSNFDATYVNQPNNLTYNISITNVGGLGLNTAQNGDATVTYWTMVQDAESTSSLWSPVASIVFTSATLPLVFEQNGVPVKYGIGNAGPTTSSTQSAFTPIITDVAIAAMSAFDYRGMIYYAPTAEYRMTSFQNSRTPIIQIDVQVFWKNRLDGNLYPLTMYNLSSASMKIMFRKKLSHRDKPDQ